MTLTSTAVSEEALKSSILVLLIVFFVLFVPIAACPQNAGAVESQLNAEYGGKVLMLRGFYSGKEIEFTENGTALGGQEVGSWTLANIEIRSIEILPTVLEINGERLGSWFTKGKAQTMKAGKVTIRIARPSNTTAEPLDAARKQLDSIFVKPDQIACSDLPDFWQLYCSSKNDPNAPERVWNEILTKNHLTPYNSKLKPDVASKSPITAPVVQISPDPKYTDAARKHRAEGTTVMKLVVEENGRPAAVTILRPVGMGLDEEAVRCVSQTWRFRPATQDGKPVTVQINVEMNFRCCP